ncbi:polysaccharide ABC transporter ATP-binding protein [Paenibacillus tarimensis]
MSKHSIELVDVGKKFFKGSGSNRLRDIIQNYILKRKIESNDFWALENINFHIDKGETLGIIGANGAGKSTLLKIISGVMVPTCGKVEINGTVGGLIELGAGFHSELTGRENIYINGSILGLKEKEISERIDQIINFSGLNSFIDTPIKKYSSGMKVRLGFAIAITIDTDIVLMDEVLSVGDAAFRKRAMHVLETYMKEKAIIFVSHNMDQIKTVCDNCIVLQNGKIVYKGDPQSSVKYYLEEVVNKKTAFISMDVLNPSYLSEARLLDNNGNEAGLFDSNEIIINVKYKFSKNVNKCKIRVRIKSDQTKGFLEEICLFVEDLIVDKTSSNLKIENTFSVGNYSIDIDLLDGNQIIQMNTDILKFKVSENVVNKSYKGIINIPIKQFDNSDELQDSYSIEVNQKNEVYLYTPNEKKDYSLTFYVHRIFDGNYTELLYQKNISVQSNKSQVIAIEANYLSTGKYKITVENPSHTTTEYEYVFDYFNDKHESNGLIFPKHDWC